MTFSAPLHSKLNVFPIADTDCTLHAFSHSNLFNKHLVLSVLKDLIEIGVKEGVLKMALPKDELSAEIFKGNIELEKGKSNINIENKKEELSIIKKPKGLRYE